MSSTSTTSSSSIRSFRHHLDSFTPCFNTFTLRDGGHCVCTIRGETHHLVIQATDAMRFLWETRLDHDAALEQKTAIYGRLASDDWLEFFHDLHNAFQGPKSEFEVDVRLENVVTDGKSFLLV
eukprot:TRINITY_DN34123_c0_g1_i1.p1 TRINITY_DN34123_c0_g1~~TRINITY_DN34123_c0_g1_i1.p1  ORF type:complete len:142 (-),score=27.47 TRINITY_DN34123_c0_g1_i1:95-463(-)